jgi:hypothetical protein
LPVSVPYPVFISITRPVIVATRRNSGSAARFVLWPDMVFEVLAIEGWRDSLPFDLLELRDLGWTEIPPDAYVPCDAASLN